MNKEPVATLALCAALLAGIANGAEAPANTKARPWDVTDTGEPARDVDITTSEGTWISVDVSPDGTTLLFDLLGDLYTLPAAGGTATLLRGGPAFERQPRFSPDGTKILFISDIDGTDNIWIADRDGENPRQISRETLNKVTNPAWSPDGEYIAATRMSTQTLGFLMDIGLFHIGGGMGRVLVDTPQSKKPINEAHFSPDGKHLYYTENTSAGAPTHLDANQPNYAIKRRNLATGETEKLVRGYGSATTAQVSPDGRRMAFVRRVKAKTTLFLRDLESGRESPIYDELGRDGQVGLAAYGYYPQFDWFPDNRHVAIWGRGGLLRVDMDQAQAEEIPFRATATHTLIDTVRFRHDLAPASFRVQSIRGTTTSPDGKGIVFSALGHLWMKALPDGAPNRVTEASGFEFEPSYSPDGRSIVYVSWDDEAGGAVRIVSARGGSGRTLHASTGILRAPVFSPDGSKIAFFVDQPNDLMGGYRVKPGIYWMPRRGGEPTWVAAGGYPAFSPDGERIYFERGTNSLYMPNTELRSIRLDGLDDRKHAASADAYDYRLSPDHRWLAFRQHHNVYVMPYVETGTGLSVNAVTGKDVQVAKASRHAGWDAHWSADASTLHWMLGDEYYATAVASLFPYLSGAEAAAAAPDAGLAVGLEAETDMPAGKLAFVNARIVTMAGDAVIEGGSVLVDGNRIAAVGEDIDIPADAKVIDVERKTIMPGLIDMHGHLTLYRPGLSPQKHAPYFAALAYGVTTNFDPSSSDHPTATNTELLRAGLMVGPRYVGTGAIIYGLAGNRQYVPINSLEDARSAIRRKLELGSYTIKSYMQPMRRQRQQLIKAAREREVMVMPEGELHFYNQLTMILDGHTTIEHNNPMGMLYDDVIQLLAASGTAMTPTLLVTSGAIFGENYFYQHLRPWEEPKVRLYVQNTLSMYSPLGGGASQPPYARGMVAIKADDALWDIGFREAARALKRASDAGVLVNAGAHGQIQGLGMHWEMWLLAEGGMDNMEVLRTATINPAITLGADDQIGSIEVGKLADLIVLDGNPLQDIRNTNTVVYTMINGRLYDSLSMNEIGNYDRPRTRFFWELPDYNGIDWNESYQQDDTTRFSGHGPDMH